MPIDPRTASLIVGGANLAASVGSGIGASSRQKRAIKAQKEADALAWQRSQEAATTAYNRSVDMWNQENEYNSFANQSARMEAAGMNPATMYGFGSGSNANIASASAPDAIPADVPAVTSREPMDNPVGESIVQGLRSAVSDVVSLQSSLQALDRQKIENDILRADKIRAESDLDDYLHGTDLSEVESWQSTDESGNPVVETTRTTRRSESGRARKVRGDESAVSGAVQSIAESAARTRLVDNTIGLQTALTSLYSSQKKMTDAQAAYYSKQADLLQKDLDNYIKNWGGPVGAVLTPIVQAFGGFLRGRR